MKYLWHFTGRCKSCGQKLKSEQTIEERLQEINNIASHLAVKLGRQPQTQTCKECYKVVFEGEPGFTQSLLLIDFC